MAENSGLLRAVSGQLNELMGALKSNIDPSTILNTVKEVDIEAKKVIKTFGEGGARTLEIKKNLTDSVTSIIELGGGFQDLIRIQTQVATTLGRNVVLQKEQFDELYKVGATTGAEVDTIVNSFKDAGYSIYDSSNQMTKVLDVARSLGVNSKSVTDKVYANMEKLNQFQFKGGVEGLARMAAQATSLRFDMNKTLEIADDLFDPDKAIDMAASLQRLGVRQSALLDPLKLMNLAQNDPEQLQKEIVNMTKSFATFNQTSGKFEIPEGSVRRLKEIGTTLHMSYGEISKLTLGAADLDRKMSKIKFPDTFSEEQKQFISNITEMGPGGEYKMKIDGKELGINEALDELKKNPDKMKNLMEASKPKSMEDLLKEQRDIQQQMGINIAKLADRTGLALAGSSKGDEVLQKMIGTLDNIAKKSEDVYKIPDIRNQFEKMNVDEIYGHISKLATGENGLSQTIENLKKDTGEFSTYVTTEWDKTIKMIKEGLDSSFGTGSGDNIFNKMMDYGNELGEGVETLLNGISTAVGTVLGTTAPNQGNGAQNTPPSRGQSGQSGQSGRSGQGNGGGTNTPPPRSQGQSAHASTLNINVNVTGQNGIDKAMVTTAVVDSFNNPIVQQKLASVAMSVNTNYGVSGGKQRPTKKTS